MALLPDDAAVALADMRGALADSVPGGWSRRVPGAMAMVTGMPVHTLNAVLALAPEADPKLVAVLLHDVRSTGLPHCLQTRPGGLVPDHASGLELAGEVPLMVLDALERLRAPEPEGLVVEPLQAEGWAQHLDAVAEGFGAPRDAFAAIDGADLLARAGVTAYLGRVGDRVVTTGLGIVRRGVVGVFNVGTPPELRGRGFGGAVTARVVRDGWAAGARAALLQSSEAGRPVYQGLGFVTVEEWPVWQSPS